jgi:hypothetical protein
VVPEALVEGEVFKESERLGRVIREQVLIGKKKIDCDLGMRFLEAYQ